MASDLVDFAETIKRLRHQFDRADLSKQIANAEPGAKKAETFLIKMEIKRLAQPIQRRIDLRDVSKSVCEQIEKANVTHFLDDPAAEDFEEEYKKYANQYTTGVYEFVVERAKLRAKNPGQDENSAKVEAPQHLSLNRFFQRKDERIYLASKINLFYRDPSEIDKSEMGAHRVVGMTVDISESGLGFKIPTANYKPLKKMYIRFVGLEQEFTLGEPLNVCYQRLRSEVKNDQVHIIAVLDETQTDKTVALCKALIKQCIQVQRRRNRVSVDNTVDAVSVKVHEQFVNTNMNCLPVFIMKQNSRWLPKVVLSNTSNETIQEFIQHPSRGFVLSHAFASDIVQRRLSAESEFVSTLFLLRFRDKNKNLNFALFRFDEALQNPSIVQLIKKGLRQKSVRLIRAHVSAIDAAQSCHVPSSLPDSAGEAFANLNRPPGNKLSKMMSAFERLCVVCDITPSARLLGFDPDAPDDADSAPLNIRPYLLNTDESMGKVIRCSVETADSRLEDRFAVSVKVKIKRKRDRTGESLKGVTSNVSSRGLCVSVETSHKLVVGEDVSVDMLLPFSKTANWLENQKYKVVALEGLNLRLALSGDVASHEGRIALRDGIFSNLDTIKAIGSKDPVYGFSKAIRNVFAGNHINLRALTAKRNGEHFVRSLMHSEQTLPIILHQDLDVKSGLDMLSTHLTFRKKLFEHIFKLDEGTTSTTFHMLVVARKKRQASELNFVFKDVPEDMTSEQFKFVYSNLKTFGSPLFLRINVSLKGEIFDKYFRDEMRYLLRYARAKYQQVVDHIDEITTVVEIQNLTDLALLIEPDKEQETILM